MGPASPGGHRHGYWSNFVTVRAGGGDDVERDIALVKMCTGSISGTILDRATGDPLPDVRVEACRRSFGWRPRHDRRDRPVPNHGAPARPNNRPIDYLVYAASGDSPFTTVHLDGCGDSEETELRVRAQQDTGRSRGG